MSYSTFIYLNIAWISLAFLVFPVAINIRAPYGRHVKAGWGMLVDNRLGWILMELPTLFCCVLIYCLGTMQLSAASLVFVTAFLIHYINRIFIYPLRTKTNGKKIPLAIVLMAFFFNVVNGTNIGFELAYFKDYSTSWLSSPQFIIGIALFCIGLSINWWADHTLIHLRKPGETGYKIPKGQLFEVISCPNYFGEIIEWIGFAIMTWTVSGFAFAIWTMANLIPRSLNHHQWYQQKFHDYPKKRKAIIPFII